MKNHLTLKLTKTNKKFLKFYKKIDITDFPVLITGSDTIGKSELIFDFLTQLLDNKEGFIYCTRNSRKIKKDIDKYLEKNKLKDLSIHTNHCTYIVYDDIIHEMKYFNFFNNSNFYFLDIINPFIGNDKFFEYIFPNFGKILSIALKYLKKIYGYVPLKELLKLKNINYIEYLNKKIKSDIIFKNLKNICALDLLLYEVLVDGIEKSFSNTNEKNRVLITDLYIDNQSILNFIDNGLFSLDFESLFFKILHFIDMNSNYEDKKTYILRDERFKTFDSFKYHNNYIFSDENANIIYESSNLKNIYFNTTICINESNTSIDSDILTYLYKSHENNFSLFNNNIEMPEFKINRQKIKNMKKGQCIIFLRRKEKIIPYHYIKLDKNDYFL